MSHAGGLVTLKSSRDISGFFLSFFVEDFIPKLMIKNKDCFLSDLEKIHQKQVTCFIMAIYAQGTTLSDKSAFSSYLMFT